MGIRNLQEAFVRPFVKLSMEVIDDNATTFRTAHRFDIVAQISARFFLCQYFWTGTGPSIERAPRIECPIDTWGFPKHKVHGPVIVEGESRILLIDLGRTLSLGEPDTIRFSHQLKDSEKTFQPYFGYSPKKGTAGLELDVTLPCILAKNVRFETISIETGAAISSETGQGLQVSGGKVNFLWNIGNPRTENTKYRIVWN